MEHVLLDTPEIPSMVSKASAFKVKRSAFVFITAEPNLSHDALEDLRKLDAVQEVYLARGAYDIVAKVNGESLEHIRDEVLKNIRNIVSIKSVLALTVV